MPSFKTMKRLNGISASSPKTVGQLLKNQSDMIMEETWDNDPQSRTAYLYDYFHDSEPDLNIGLHSDKDPLKIPVQIKFITHAHNSDSNDQVSYWIQFKPSYECSVDYYKELYGDKYKSQFPVGLYCDVPDDKGVYRRWLVCEDATRYDIQFDKYSIYPTNYQVMWIENHGSVRYKRKMWGLERLRNS